MVKSSSIFQYFLEKLVELHNIQLQDLLFKFRRDFRTPILIKLISMGSCFLKYVLLVLYLTLTLLKYLGLKSAKLLDHATLLTILYIKSLDFVKKQLQAHNQA